MKKNIQGYTLIFLIGILLSLTGVYATETYKSYEILFDNTGTTLSSDNVQDAIDELYMKMHPLKSFVADLSSISDSSRSYSTYVTSANSGLYYTEDASTYGENGQKIYYYAGTYDDVDN